MEAEVVEVDVPPAARGVVDQADEDLLAHVLRKVDDHRLQVLAVVAGNLEDHLIAVLANDLDARSAARAAADEEAGEGLRDLERHGGERALRPVASDLVRADPELAGVLAAHVAAAVMNGVSLDRLPGEGLAFGRPVASVPVSKSRLSGAPLSSVGRVPCRGR